MIRSRHRAGRIAAWAMVLLVVAGWTVTLRPQYLGGPAGYIVVRGDSMMPGYHPGDLVVVRGEASYQVGDVVAYRVPAHEVGAGLVVIHRIIGGSAAAGYVMQGDHNPVQDPWIVPRREIVGAAWVAVPRLGAGIALLRRPGILAGLIASLVVGLVVAHPGVRRPTRGPVARKPRRRMA
jgi:signal peptidase